MVAIVIVYIRLLGRNAARRQLPRHYDCLPWDEEHHIERCDGRRR